MSNPHFKGRGFIRRQRGNPVMADKAIEEMFERMQAARANLQSEVMALSMLASRFRAHIETMIGRSLIYPDENHLNAMCTTVDLYGKHARHTPGAERPDEYEKILCDHLYANIPPDGACGLVYNVFECVQIDFFRYKDIHDGFEGFVLWPIHPTRIRHHMSVPVPSSVIWNSLSRGASKSPMLEGVCDEAWNMLMCIKT